MAGGRLGRGRAGRRGARERPARARCREGRGLRDPRPHLARMGAVRLRARPGGRSRCAGLLVELAARRGLPVALLGRRRRARRGRGAAREGRGRRPALRDRLRRSRFAARRWARVRDGAAGRPRRARRLDRRGRPLHLHLHVGHDRTAEGVHDPAPQLLRDGAEGRRAAGAPDPCGRRDAALPAAGSQLRTAAPSLGRLHRVHDRVPARSVAGRRRAAARTPDDLPERPARVREDPCGRDVSVRRAPRPARSGSRTGRSASAGACPASGRRAGRFRRRSPHSTGWPTGSSTRRSRSVSVDGSAS